MERVQLRDLIPVKAGMNRLRDELIHILKTAEAARGRVNALADQNRRDLEKLISLAGAPRAVAYRRSGKLG